MTSFVQCAPSGGFGDLGFDEDDDLAFAEPASVPAAPVEHTAAYRRARTRQDVLVVIDRMVVVFKDPRRPDLDRLPDLHGLADELQSLAGVLHLKVMTRSALLFSTLTDRMRLARRWDHTSVAVFIEAFRRLHAADDDSPLAGKILEGLKRVADRANPYAVT